MKKYCTTDRSPFENAVSQPSSNQRRTLFTIKVGAITQWVRDILAIILMWKLIMAV
jgi:hypothetical protein